MTQIAPPEILDRIGRRVRARRQVLGLTIRNLAESAGISPRFLSNVEAGSGNIAVGRLERIARALGVELSSLVRPRRRSAIRESIECLLDGRSEAELSRLLTLLEVNLGRRGRRVIALLGIRGSGKSTVGPTIAKALGLPFEELDDRITERSGMDLPEIFALHGERHYRRMEGRCLSELIARDLPCVVALPGGVVGNEESFSLVLSTCLTVWLRAEADDYWNRVYEQGDVRLIQSHDNAKDDLRELVHQREPLYRQAHVVVQTSATTPDEVVRRALEKIREYRLRLNAGDA